MFWKNGLIPLWGGRRGESQLESVTAVEMDFSQLELPEVEQVPATAKLGKSHNKLRTHPGACPARLWQNAHVHAMVLQRTYYVNISEDSVILLRLFEIICVFLRSFSVDKLISTQTWWMGNQHTHTHAAISIEILQLNAAKTPGLFTFLKRT